MMRALYQALIPGLWLLWVAGWTMSAFATKRTVRTESLASRLSHWAPLLLGIGLMTFRFPWLIAHIYPQTIWSFTTGAMLVIVGLGFAVWARVHLAGNWSGSVTLKQDHTLTRTGPYHLVRHPIYTGILTAIIGSAVAEGEWRGLVGFALITVSFLRKIIIEEHFMTTQFGNDYARYQAEVPALVPWTRFGRAT